MQVRLASHLLGQGACRISGHRRCYLHRSLLPLPVSQVDLPKRLLCPLGSRQQATRLHQVCPFSSCDFSLMDSITTSHPKLRLTVRWVPGLTTRCSMHRPEKLSGREALVGARPHGAPYTGGGKGLRLSNIRRTACALTLAG